jgi:hypothetical protein
LIHSKEASTVRSVTALPPILQAEHDRSPLARLPWYRSLAPAYLGVVVWAPFFDSLWIADLARYSLLSLVGVVLFGSIVSAGLFYYIPASWGFRARQPLGIVAASTFGTVGSEWITGILLAIGYVFWLAVSIDYSVDTTLLGLRSCGLIAPGNLRRWELGPVLIEGPVRVVYLVTAIFWIYIAGTSAAWKITGVVGSLMKVYAPAALFLLTVVALLVSPLLGHFRTDLAAKVVQDAGPGTAWRLLDSTMQHMTGYFAMLGLASVDWGARAESRRDLVVTGITTIVGGATWTAMMSLVVVACAVARLGEKFDWFFPDGGAPLRLTFRWGVYHGVGGIPAGIVLILFGLAALAPACYATWVYSERLAAHFPILGQAGWIWLGSAFALILAVTSWASSLEVIYFCMGAIFGPVVGAMAGDWFKQRGEWGGIRPGVNRPGVVAWAAGLGITIALQLGRENTPGEGSPWFSTAFCGYVAAFAYYTLLSRLGREETAIAMAPQVSDGSV